MFHEKSLQILFSLFFFFSSRRRHTRSKRDFPKPRFAPPKAAADLETLHAVISNRYDVLSRYAKSVRRTYAEEVERLKHWSPRDAEVLHSLRRALLRGQALAGAERARLAGALKTSRALAAV